MNKLRIILFVLLKLTVITILLYAIIIIIANTIYSTFSMSIHLNISCFIYDYLLPNIISLISMLYLVYKLSKTIKL